MNPFVSAVLFVSVLFMGVGCATVHEEPEGELENAEGRALQIQVDVPPAWHPWLADDLSEAFFFRVRHIFKRHGYTGEFTEVRRLREPRADEPLLNLHLYHWEVDRVGNVRCTLRGELRDSEGNVTPLGIYTATEFTWGTRSQWELAEDFRDAADDIAEQIWRDLDDKNLLEAVLEK